MPKPTYTQIKSVRQSTFRTGEAPTHIIGYNKATNRWEVIASSVSPNVNHAKQWCHAYVKDNFPTIKHTWLGCMADAGIQEAFAA